MSHANTPAAGQIWRNTRRDSKPEFAHLRNETVRLISKNENGGWLVRKLTDSQGRDASFMRLVRIKEHNLISGYVFVPEQSHVS